MRISPWERVLIFGKKGKLSPIYMGSLKQSDSFSKGVVDESQ